MLEDLKELKEWFNKGSKLCKLAKPFHREAMSRWSAAKVEFLLKVNLILNIFNKMNLQHLTSSQDFKVTTQLQLEIYYHAKKLTMEEKIIAAIQHIHLKSKQRVTSQRIFRFINKGAVSIGCEIFQDSINGLEIDGRIYKKRGKNPFFSKKMMSWIMRKKLINPLNHLMQLKSWNVLLTKFLEIFKT